MRGGEHASRGAAVTIKTNKTNKTNKPKTTRRGYIVLFCSIQYSCYRIFKQYKIAFMSLTFLSFLEFQCRAHPMNPLCNTFQAQHMIQQVQLLGQGWGLCDTKSCPTPNYLLVVGRDPATHGV